MKYSDYYAPFAIWGVNRQIAYCNNHICSRLKKLKIDWDMNTERIIFAGRRFYMGTIDDGRAEKYIDELERKQNHVLDEYY